MSCLQHRAVFRPRVNACRAGEGWGKEGHERGVCYSGLPACQHTLASPGTPYPARPPKVPTTTPWVPSSWATGWGEGGGLCGRAWWSPGRPPPHNKLLLGPSLAPPSHCSHCSLPAPMPQPCCSPPPRPHSLAKQTSKQMGHSSLVSSLPSPLRVLSTGATSPEAASRRATLTGH
jgi:hypothetical protein